MSRNFITSSTNHSFGSSFSSLVHVDVSRNGFSDVGFAMSVIQSFEGLVLVNFSDNKIVGQLSESFVVASGNLSSFVLSYNLVSRKLPSGIVGDAVEVLSLSSKNFSSGFSEIGFGV